MLKPYIYGKHKMEEFHPLLVTAFEIICNAKKNDLFDIDLFPPDLQVIMNAEIQNENDLLFQPLKDIFNAVKIEGAALKRILRQGLKNNNLVKELCTNINLEPILYRDLPENISKLLKPFFNNLYEKIFNRAYFIVEYEGLKKHFNQLISNSEMRVCPFCGVTDMSSEFDEGRDAYDHYLPKGIFPFSSVNFANLIPMCNECNSKHKLEKAIIFEDLRGKDKTKRRKAYYPYDPELNNIGLVFSSADGKPLPSLQRISPKQLKLDISSADPEKTESWNRVFRIDKRYKAKSCSFFKEWFDTLLQEYKKENAKRLRRGEILLSWDDFFDDELDIKGDELLKNKNMIRVALFNFLKNDCDFIGFLKTLPI